jgi:hypothetical protein
MVATPLLGCYQSSEMVHKRLTQPNATHLKRSLRRRTDKGRPQDTLRLSIVPLLKVGSGRVVSWPFQLPPKE